MERKIAKAFICRNKRERFIFEMSKRRRFDAICRLPAIIDRTFAIMQSRKFPAPIELVRIMHDHGVKDICYVLSADYDDGFDGEYVSLTDAAEKLHINGFPSLIVGLPSGFSHFREESYASYQPNCFLRPETRFDGVACMSCSENRKKNHVYSA